MAVERFFYRDPTTTEVWEFDKNYVDEGKVPESFVRMTPAEVELHINPPPTPLTPEQHLALARAERDRLLTYATLRINPLQYAADVDEASEEELALLKLWKKYSVAVSKTETKPGWPENPQWPVPPMPLEVNNSETETLE